MPKIIFILLAFFLFLSKMASTEAVDRTERDNFVFKTHEIRNLPNYDEIHHELSLNRCTLIYCLSCTKKGGFMERRAYF